MEKGSKSSTSSSLACVPWPRFLRSNLSFSVELLPGLPVLYQTSRLAVGVV